MDHDAEEGHQCAAGMHTCGELCSLVENNGNRLCSRTCMLDWYAQQLDYLTYTYTSVSRIPHEQHTCDRSLSCPIKCQLCKSYCATGDHFHALEPDAVHLCGQVYTSKEILRLLILCRQKHDCKHLCELGGVCEINTTPQSIESTFVGRHATFTYTKVRVTSSSKLLGACLCGCRCLWIYPRTERTS